VGQQRLSRALREWRGSSRARLFDRHPRARAADSTAEGAVVVRLARARPRAGSELHARSEELDAAGGTVACLVGVLPVARGRVLPGALIGCKASHSAVSERAGW
jgi:DNA-binding transcriptional LysR family regulator